MRKPTSQSSLEIRYRFLYMGKPYEHVFYSLQDLENYFRWEPERGELVGYFKPSSASTNPAPRSRDAKIYARLLDDKGKLLDQITTGYHSELVAWLSSHQEKESRGQRP